MFRLLRAALLGLIIGIVVLWFTNPVAFMVKLNGFLYESGLFSNPELEQRIRDERALSELPVNVLPGRGRAGPESKPEPDNFTSGELSFTEDVLKFQPDEYPPQSELHPELHLIAVDDKSKALWLSPSKWVFAKLYWWQPETSRLKSFELPKKPSVFLKPILAAATPSGLLIVGGSHAPYKEWSDNLTRLVFIDPNGHLAKASLQVIRESPELVVLNDGSVLVFGGYNVEFTINPKRNSVSKPSRISKSMAVEHIRYVDKQLHIERLADLPGEPRRGMEMVELDNGQVMVVGGTTSEYAGGKPLTAETYILDIKANNWRAGPPMNTPRSDPALQRLPDGKVLVAGGWTPELAYQNGPSASTELWEPDNNRFVPGNSLPLPLARHMALWAPGQEGRQLLLLGGMAGPGDGNGQVLGLDLDSGLWSNVAQNCNDYYGTKSRVKVATLLHENIPYILCFKTDNPVERAWSSNRLRLPGLPVDSQLALDDAGYGVNLNRSGMAFLAPTENLAGLTAGGSVNGAQSAAADGILPDGRIISLAPLNHRRAGAQAFRLSTETWLVVGGVQGDSTRRTLKYLPAELLNISDGLESARWHELDITMQKGAIWEQLNDSRFVLINPDGSVERIDFEQDLEGNLQVAKREALAPLNRVRNQESGKISVREVDDGRLIVAGGSVQQFRVAVLDENTINATEPDRYQSFGYFKPASHYDIYNPQTNSWQMSAQTENQAQRFAILPDGRVATWAMQELLPEADTPEGAPVESKAILEISSSDGKQWQPLGGSAPHIDFVYPSGNDDLYEIYGELFITGTMPKTYAGRLNALEWFNPDKQSWEKLWQSTEKESLLDHQGHLIKRTLTNGKKVILPVKAP